MTYVPYTWTTGDLITASRLNNLEAGATEALAAAAQAAPFFVTITAETEDDTTTYTADKTYAEILAAVEAGRYGYALYDGGYYHLSGINSPYGAYFSRDYAADSILYSEMFTIEMGVEETDTDVSYTSAEYTLTPAE